MQIPPPIKVLINRSQRTTIRTIDDHKNVLSAKCHTTAIVAFERTPAENNPFYFVKAKISLSNRNRKQFRI